jgi:hypothetical protein
VIQRFTWENVASRPTEMPSEKLVLDKYPYCRAPEAASHQFCLGIAQQGSAMKYDASPRRSTSSPVSMLTMRIPSDLPKPDIPTSVVLATWLASLFLIASISLPLPQIGFAQDLGVMLDAGWRYFQGMHTHADYHSPLGPLFAIIFGLPMKIGGPTYASYKLLPPVITAIFTIWTAVVSSTSLPPWTRAVLAAAIGAASGGLFHLGFPIEALSFAVFYNRVGFGLLCIIGLSALLPRGSRGLPAWVSPTRHASIAIASVMLLFLKVNFFFAALPFWLASALLHSRSRLDTVTLGVTLTGTCLFFLNEIEFRIDRMLFDLSMAADARRACLDSFFFPVRNALANHDFVIILILTTVALVPGFRAFGTPIKSAGIGLGCLWSPALLGYALTLMQSHGDGRGVPLALVGIAAALAWVLPPRSEAPAVDPDKTTSYAAATVMAGTIGKTCLMCAASLFLVPHAYSYYFLLQVSQSVGPRQFQAPGIKDLYVGSFANNLEPNAVGKMNDAHQLLSRHTTPRDSLQYMDMNNIYTFASHLRSPRQSMLFWDNRSSYTAARHPPEADFTDSDFIMAPKQQLTQGPLEKEWWSIYAYAIENQYELVEETAYFKLWRRTPSADGLP